MGNSLILDEMLERQEQARALEAQARESNRSVMLALLKRLGTTRVVITFDGGGDQGQVEGITWEGLSDLKQHSFDETLKIMNYGKGTLYDVSFTKNSTVRDALDHWAYELLDGTQYDWVNNEGGWGTITITPSPVPVGESEDPTPEIAIDMNVRIITSNNYYLEG